MPLGLDFVEQIRFGGDRALPYVALQFETWAAQLAPIVPIVDSMSALTSGYLKVTTAANITTVSSVAGVAAVDVTTGTIAAARFPAFTGDVTTAAGAINTAIGNLKVTNAMLAGSITAAKLVGTDITAVGTLTALTVSGTLTGSSVSLSNTINLITTGTAPTAGTLTLVAGTKTVSTTAATSTALLFFQRISTGGTIGFATTYTKSTNISFTISSDNVLDTSTYAWEIVETH